MRCISTAASSKELKVTPRHDWRWEAGWTLKENKHLFSIYHMPWKNVVGAFDVLMAVAVGGCKLTVIESLRHYKCCLSPCKNPLFS